MIELILFLYTRYTYVYMKRKERKDKKKDISTDEKGIKRRRHDRREKREEDERRGSGRNNSQVIRCPCFKSANRIEPEHKKRKHERGKYLHPELFGKTAEGLHSASEATRPR